MTRASKTLLLAIGTPLVIFAGCVCLTLHISPSARNPAAVRAVANQEKWVVLLTGSSDSRMYDLATGNCVWDQRDSRLRDLVSWSSSPGFEYVAIVQQAGGLSYEREPSGATLIMFDTDSGREIGSYTYSGGLTYPSWSPDTQYCASATSDGHLLLFHITTAGLSLERNTAVDGVRVNGSRPPAVLSKNDLVFEAASRGRNINHLSLQSGKSIDIGQGVHPQAVSATEVAFGFGERLLKKDIISGQETEMIHHSGPYTGMWNTVSPDHEYVAYCRPASGWGGHFGMWVAKLDRSTVGPVVEKHYGQIASFSRGATQHRIGNLTRWLSQRATAMLPATSRPTPTDGQW